MNVYLRFENDRQVEAKLSSRKPGTAWYKAPAGYDGTRLCIWDAENGIPRLITDAEIEASILQARRAEMQQSVGAKADEIRAQITQGSTAAQREGWQVKADICRLYRIEQVLQKAGILSDGQRLLSTDEIDAVAAEAEERGQGETEAQILAIWEARSGAFAKAVCRIDGVGSKAWATIEQAKPEELEAVAEFLLRAAENKKSAVLAAVGQ